MTNMGPPLPIIEYLIEIPSVKNMSILRSINHPSFLKHNYRSFNICFIFVFGNQEMLFMAVCFMNGKRAQIYKKGIKPCILRIFNFTSYCVKAPLVKILVKNFKGIYRFEFVAIQFYNCVKKG